jgi:hypothetical protein
VNEGNRIGREKSMARGSVVFHGESGQATRESAIGRAD